MTGEKYLNFRQKNNMKLQDIGLKINWQFINMFPKVVYFGLNILARKKQMKQNKIGVKS